MPLSTRPYVTAGVALVGASVISVTPVSTEQPEIRSATADISLVAATQPCAQDTATTLCREFPGTDPVASFVLSGDGSSIFYVPANLIIALANIPYNFVNALGAGNVQLGSEPDSGFSFEPTYEGVTLTQPDGHVVGLSSAFDYGGSWWMYSRTNVLGTDAADVAKYQALVNVMIPFPALSVPIGNMVAAIAASQLPMNVGCAGTGPGACDHPEAILSKMFDIRHVFSLFSPGGYKFPTVREGITCNAQGKCNTKDPNGAEVPWSEETVELDLTDPFTSVFANLTQKPDFSSIKFPTFEMIRETVTRLIRVMNTAFNPFVVGAECPICGALTPKSGSSPVNALALGAGPEILSEVTEAPAEALADTARSTEPKAGSEVSQVPVPAPAPAVTTNDNAVQVTTLSATATPAASTETAVLDEDEGSELDVPVSTGGRHRKPSDFSQTFNEVRNNIDATLSKLSEGFKKPASKSAQSPTTAEKDGQAAVDSTKSDPASNKDSKDSKDSAEKNDTKDSKDSAGSEG